VGSNLALVSRRATLILAAGLLALAVVYLAFAQFGGWNHQTAGHTLLYWAAIVYSRTALLLAAISLLVFICLLIIWIVDTLRDRPVPRVMGWAPFLSLVALVIASAAALPTVLVQLVHQDNARLGEHVYQLALRMALDGDNQYLLYECDGLGLVCTSRATSSCSSGLGKNPLELSARLEVEPAANAVLIRVDGETVYTYLLGD
jgi:hypothetical protein